MDTPVLPDDHLPCAERFVADGLQLSSIRGVNALDWPEKRKLYIKLLPPGLLEPYGIDAEALQDEALFKLSCPAGTGSMELVLYHPDELLDPMLYLQLADTPNNQLIVLLFVVNDPHAPRFDVDRDWQGRPTKFGTITRSLEAEVAAMQAGLMPGQVRRGLGLARQLMPVFDAFVACLGRKLFMLDPLTYNAAIMFERYGCAYVQGRSLMEWIHAEFAPGGKLYEALDGSTPFRQAGAQQTVLGRSWAIHDGILGRPFTGVKMYKRVGEHAGVCTFPAAVWK